MASAHDTHCCLLCRSTLVPVFRAFCARCFPVVPWTLRAEMMHAWRARARNQVVFQEKLIELHLWDAERKAGDIERAQ